MNINRKILVLIGWALVFTVILLSLIPISGALPDIKNSDKIGHFIAYFSIMLWFAWLYQKPWVRNIYAICFICMGGLLEFLQSLTSYRSLDIDDFHMNTIGVIVGFVFSVLTYNLTLIKNTFDNSNKTS
jgi:VanZ family protein